ncbi:MAG: hypothetical protein M3P49_07505 [Actinomycetota bacterium]|nr:hypothetical protein [Actinomycetota bacterium]
MNWHENDDLFFRELDEGRRWQLYVASKLLEAGLWVQVPEGSVRDSIEDVPAYANEADIWVTRKRPAKIEVKSRRVEFTGPHDIPPNRRPFIVTTESSWNNADTKPIAVVIVSQETRGIVVASSRRSREWEVRYLYDNVRRIHDYFLCTPVERLFTFDELTKHLQRRELGG